MKILDAKLRSFEFLFTQFKSVLNSVSTALATCKDTATYFANMATKVAEMVVPALALKDGIAQTPGKSYGAAFHFVNNAMDACDSKADAQASKDDPWYEFCQIYMLP